MADKTPVRVVFNESNVATGLAEFQTGDTVPVSHGGTGITAIGSAGQVLKVNAAGSGLEFGAEGDISITNLVAPTNADLTFSTSGTGNIVLDAVTVRGTTFSAADSTKITFAESVDVTGTLTASGLSFPTSDGSANQVIATDGSGSLSFISAASTGDLLFVGSTIGGQSNADISIQPSGTGNVILGALTVNGTTLNSSDSSKITFAEAVDVTGALVAATSLNIASSGATVTGILDEDNMASDSNTKLATQQSIKAYIDGEVSGLSQTSIAQGNSNVTVADSGTGNVTIEVDGTDRVTVTAATTTTATGHTITLGATNTTTGGAIKFLEGTDNGTNTVTLVGPASTANVTVTLPSSAGTLALTSDITFTASSTDTLTNKTFDVEGTGNSISNIDVADLKSGVLDTDISSVSGSDDTLASAKAIKTYVDAQVTAQDLDFATDDSTALSIDLDSETLQVSGGANITTSGSLNTITIALDSALTGLTSVTSTSLVTNDISSADSTAVRINDALNVDGALDVGAGLTISNGTSITSIVDEDNMSSDSNSALATQQSIKAYADTKATLSGSTDNTIATVTGAHALQGEANLTFDGSTFAVAGAATITNTSTGDSLLITSTEDSNSAAPVVTLKRNSSSPADADYIGRFKFKGENDADQEVQYASISGKIIDASDGTEDGAIEFNVKKAGSNNIAARLNSDELKLLNGTTLDVDGAGTFAGSVTATSVTTNDIVSNGSNADINITPAGTGGVVVTSGGVAFTLPTTDGNDGDFLKTDGSGGLSFASSTATPSDDTRVVIKNNKAVSTSARTVDYFQASSADMAWYFVALNDLQNDHSSASCFAVAHNDSDAFIGGPRGGASGTSNSLPSTTADVSSNQVRVKITGPSDDCKISYYKIPISRANTADATAGVTVTTSNTDVDSASEVIDTFAHATFRAAKYLILIDNDSKTETGVTEALVVHNGSEAFILQYGNINTGNNDMVTLTAQIVSSNVVVSAAGLEPNLSLKIHKTLLSDSMTAVSNGNQKIIGATTVSSSATAFDNFDLDDATAAIYYVVGKNATADDYSVQEVYCSGAPGEASVSIGPYVSTKSTQQLEFTAGFKADADNSLELSVSSTSGGSTVVNAYRINCLAE